MSAEKHDNVLLVPPPSYMLRRRFNYALLPLALVVSLASYYFSSSSVSVDDSTNGWSDSVFPYREQTEWDISTSFPHKRLLSYNVTEGTWLRLDVHPITGDIVFDMLGDIYCLPVSSYKKEGQAEALAILRGVPHDSDPRFNPLGDMLVFRSDAGLGTENIWTLPWTGDCVSMALVSSPSIAGKKWESSKERAERKRSEGRLNGTHIRCSYDMLY